jgi:hypothetical protein
MIVMFALFVLGNSRRRVKKPVHRPSFISRFADPGSRTSFSKNQVKKHAQVIIDKPVFVDKLVSYLPCSLNASQANAMGGGGLTRVAQIKSDALKELAKDIPSTLLLSHAEATNRKYSYIYKAWKSWTVDFDEVIALPADPFFVGLYLIHLGQVSDSASKISCVLPALVWAHRMAGIPHTLDGSFFFCQWDYKGNLQSQLLRRSLCQLKT